TVAGASHPRRMARDATRREHPGQASRLRVSSRSRDARLDRRHRFRAAERRGARADQEVQSRARGAGPGDRRMSRSLRAWLVVVLLLARTFLPSPARAHEMTMAEMEVRETAPGEFFW